MNNNNSKFVVRSRTEQDFRTVYIRKRFHLNGHRAAIYALDQGEKPNEVLSGGGDGLVVKWDLDNPEVGQVIAQVQANIFSMKYIPHLHRLAIGNMHGGIHWIDLHTNDNIKNVAIHEKGVFDIQYFNDHIYTVGGQGRLVKWSAEDCRSLETFHISNKSLRSIDYCASRNEIAVGSSDYSIYILDATDLTIKKQIDKAHENSVFTVKYSPDGEHLMSGGRDAMLKVWRTEQEYELVSAQPAHWFTINKIIFSPSGAVFVTASRDKSAKIWDAKTFKVLKVIEKTRLVGHSNSVNSIFWTDYKNTLVTCSDDRLVMGWDVDYLYENPYDNTEKELKNPIETSTGKDK
jgi:WD40 repeat protein